MISVAIIHGFAEGPAISKKLRQALREHGYGIARDYRSADVIIAHSGGYLLLPTDLHDKIVILSAPAVGERNGSLPETMFQKIRLDIRAARQEHRTGQWLHKSFWNGMYIAGKPITVYRMLRGARKLPGQLPAFQARQVMVMSHKGDPWSERIALEQINKHSYSFVSHTGVHDDIWINPERYITVIQYLYES